MALIENTLYGKIDRVQTAIERLQAFEPPEGYWLAFSGGKDSVVIKRLAEMARVKHESHYSVTSVDHPALVRFIKSMRDVCFDIPHDKDGKPITMWNLIPKKLIPPTRIARYCCEKLKESSGKGRLVITGVRWAESVNRKKSQGLVRSGTTKNKIVLNTDNDEARRMVESCYRTQKTLVNPIIDWSDADVWEFINIENVPFCELYKCGYKRLGCIGCPMSTSQKKDFKIYPKYKNSYIRAFDRMLEERKKRELPTQWKTGEEVMEWWVGNKKNNANKNQIIFDFEE